MNTHESYVSLEIAKLLRQLGFDWECSNWYSLDGSKWITDRETNNLSPENKKRFIHCSSLAVAQRWLREEKKFNAIVTFLENDIDYAYGYSLFHEADWLGDSTDEYTTYEEALEAGIQKCLTMILEEKK